MINNQINLSVIVPAYNEARSIRAVIISLKNKLRSLDLKNYEVIVINDGSVDQTKEILKELNEIRVIEHPKNLGYGASIKSGIRLAKYNWILIIDADGTYPIDDIPKLLSQTAKYDLIVGSREKKDNAIPFERKYVKRFLNSFAGYLAGRKIPDLNSGLRIFKKEIILKYWELFPNKFSFTSTLTMVCLTHGYETIFIPIDYYKRQGKSSIKPFHFFSFLKLIIKLSLFFKPIKVFAPISVFILLIALFLIIAFFTNLTPKFFDTTFIILCATALQTFFFGLLAEVIIHNKH